MGDLLLPLRELLFHPLPVALLGLVELAVVAGVETHGLVVDVQDVGRDVVEEAVVVGDDDDDAGELLQELLQPADGENVEMVGRLVEQERVGIGSQHLGQQTLSLKPPDRVPSAS